MEVYRDKFYKIEKQSFNQTDDIFEIILKSRKNDTDKNRFFLEYLPQEIVSKYNFNNPNSVKCFQNLCCTINSPLMKMGGYNMDNKYLSDDIRYVGIKMSDPYGKIYGSFVIRNSIIIYNPLFPHFYEERDLIKFANDIYFTTMTFEDIMMQQISLAENFYINVGRCYTTKDILENGYYILEKISKEQMTEFVLNPLSGAKVYKKILDKKYT